jgi:hypothetical protein
VIFVSFVIFVVKLARKMLEALPWAPTGGNPLAD